MVQKKTALIGLAVFMYLFSSGSALASEREPYWDDILKMNVEERQALCIRIKRMAEYSNSRSMGASKESPATIPSPQVTAPVGTSAHGIQSAARAGFNIGKSSSNNGSDDYISYEVREKTRKEYDYQVNKACGTIHKGMNDIVTLLVTERSDSLVGAIKTSNDKSTLKWRVEDLIRPPFKPNHILEGDYREYNRLYEDKIAEKIVEAIDLADKKGNSEAYDILEDVLISRYPDLKKQVEEADNLKFQKW